MFKSMEGKRIPDVTFKLRRDYAWVDLTSAELFAGRNVVVFSLPGAFTPTCSSTHVPRYHQLAPALHAVPRLPAAGLVIDAAVDHPAVVAGLVIGQGALLLQQQDVQRGEALLQLVHRGRADDATAHDHHVPGPLIGHRAAKVGSGLSLFVAGCSHSEI